MHMSSARGKASYEQLSSSYNILDYMIRSITSGMINTCLPVKVIAVDVENLKVDVLSLIATIDGEGNRIEPNTLYNIPYTTAQAGKAGIVITPVVDDVGIMVSFKADANNLDIDSKSAVLPKTSTPYPVYSGIYIGSILTTPPTTVITIEDGKVEITAEDVTIKATTANIEASNVNLGDNATVELVDSRIDKQLDVHVHSFVGLSPGTPGTTGVVTVPFQKSGYTNTNIKTTV